MKTIIYKNKRTVCEIKHESKNIFSISGCEKDKVATFLKEKKGRDYIWNDLIELIDVEAGYTIKSREQ